MRGDWLEKQVAKMAELAAALTSVPHHGAALAPTKWAATHSVPAQSVPAGLEAAGEKKKLASNESRLEKS